MTRAERFEVPVTKCGFAFAGTYGHECGRPAVHACSHPSERQVNGIFWAGRCAECAKIVGGENAGMSAMVPLAGQVNVYERVIYVPDSAPLEAESEMEEMRRR